MAKTSEATLKAIKKYNTEKTDEFKIRLPKGNKALLKEYTEKKGTNITELITKLLQIELQKDGIELITKSDLKSTATE